MDAADFMARSSTYMLGQDPTQSTLLTFEQSDMSNLPVIESRVRPILDVLIRNTTFSSKYDTILRDGGSPLVYFRTLLPAKYTYSMEVFPVVVKCETGSSTRKIEELVYHSLFENVITRYTKSNQKPNYTLMDTRASEFCYRLTIKVEAVPQESLTWPHRLILLREFLIMQYLWEKYRSEMQAKISSPDQMVGFPMPFEFCNITGTEYDFTEETRNMNYYNVYGNQEPMIQAVIPQTIPDMSTGVNSTFSYMSYERLGPNLNYLVDLMRTQVKSFTLSSALKVFDQLICRLMIIHKYGVVHGDINPHCLSFGPSESCNVLYVSEFGSSIIKPESGNYLPRYHDRFASYLRFRDRSCHYVHDIESAFYVFLYLLIGRLPWDARMSVVQPADDSADPTVEQFPNRTGFTDRTVTVEDKEKFWQTQNIFKRTYGMIDLEFHEPLYRSFSFDLVESLYSKTKEILTSNVSLNSVNYSKEISIPGSHVYNYYFGLRRIVATYFRFESINPLVKDVHNTSKVELLIKQCTKDERIAWDLSHWCWNYLDSTSNQQYGKMKGKYVSSIKSIV